MSDSSRVRPGSTLEIRDLHVAVGDKEILRGVNLTVRAGETHAIMGPNEIGRAHV